MSNEDQAPALTIDDALRIAADLVGDGDVETLMDSGCDVIDVLLSRVRELERALADDGQADNLAAQAENFALKADNARLRATALTLARFERGGEVLNADYVAAMAHGAELESGR